MKKKEGLVIPFSAARVVPYDAEAEKERNAIGRRIAEARKSRGLTLAAFSRYLADFGVRISTSGVAKWETGYRIPSCYQLVALCCALDVDISFFADDFTPVLNDTGLRKLRDYRADLIASGRYRPAPRPSALPRLIEMPVSNLRVSAGNGAFLDEDSFEMVSCPADQVPDGADFGVRVSGDSMEPVFHDGDIAWVQKCDWVGIRKVGVFIYGGEGYIKVYNEQSPDPADVEAFTTADNVVLPQPVLESYNPRYEPRVIHPDAAFHIVGRVL